MLKLKVKEMEKEVIEGKKKRKMMMMMKRNCHIEV